MKNITLFLLQVLFIFHVFSNQLLTKFHQNRFKIKGLQVEVHNYSKEYFNFFKIKTYKYNRTTPAVNGTFSLKITLDDRIEVIVQAYKFLSNEYRHFPIRFQVNLKKIIDSNAAGTDILKHCGNLTDFSVFHKNVTYQFCNFILDESHFPPLVPNGKFRFNSILYYLNVETLTVFTFLEIYTPIAYPKK